MLAHPVIALAADGIDWSVGLRGSYASSSASGGSFEAVAAPEASITLEGEGATLTLGAGAELALDAAGNARFADVHASADGTYAIDPDTSLTGSVDVSLTQEAPGPPILPTNTAIAPLVLTGTAEGSGTTRFGPLDLAARVNGSRVLQGDETLYDASVVGHASDSYWRDGAGLRAGFAMSPLLTAFVDAAVSDQFFDAASPSLAVFLDNRVYTVRGGVAYSQGSVISAEASVGQAFIDYGDGTLIDQSAWIADGAIKITPNDTLTLTAALESTIAPSASIAGDTDVDYALSGNATYVVNSWLTLRGSAGATATQTLGAGTVTFGYGAGAGIDLATSGHAVWSADYAFTHDGAGPEDIHRATLGLMIRR